VPKFTFTEFPGPKLTPVTVTVVPGAPWVELNVIEAPLEGDNVESFSVTVNVTEAEPPEEPVAVTVCGPRVVDVTTKPVFTRPNMAGRALAISTPSNSIITVELEPKSAAWTPTDVPVGPWVGLICKKPLALATGRSITAKVNMLKTSRVSISLFELFFKSAKRPSNVLAPQYRRIPVHIRFFREYPYDDFLQSLGTRKPYRVTAKINSDLNKKVVMLQIFRDSHKTLSRLVGLNVAFDLLSIPFWIALTYTTSLQSASTLTVNSSTAIVDAAAAAVLFAVAFLGIIKKQKWGPYLATVGTLAQRIVGYLIFGLNGGMAVEVVWSILIIYFAYKAMQPQPQISAPKQA
jgi:hypothetical protein